MATIGNKYTEESCHISISNCLGREKGREEGRREEGKEGKREREKEETKKESKRTKERKPGNVEMTAYSWLPFSKFSRGNILHKCILYYHT